MMKKKVDCLHYEARFWYVKTLDLAYFKYVIIYLLALFFLEIQTFKDGQKGILDQIWRTVCRATAPLTDAHSRISRF